MTTRRISYAAEGEAGVAEAAALLRAGRLVAFPTETVYGLGALALDPAAVERVYAAKGRPASNPLILHIADLGALASLTPLVTERAARLANAFWPGPLTLVVPRAQRVPDAVTAGLDSVAVRMPRHPIALSLIGRVGEPVAAPSANLFCHTSPTSADHVLADLGGRIDAVLDGGPTEIGLESTVLDLRGPEAILLRPGGVAREELERLLGEPVSLHGAAHIEEGFRSPGLFPRHYSPRAELRLFRGPDATSREALLEAAARTPGSGVLAYDEDTADLVSIGARSAPLGARGDLRTVAHRLYAAMRELDRTGVTLILARTVDDAGLGSAINDRLQRAAATLVDLG